MKKYRLLKEHFKSERGVVAILVGIGIVLLVSMLALAIDVAYTWVTRNELQNISDASSLAAARKLGDIYGDLSNPLSDEQVAAIRQPAIDMGSANRAGGKGIVIDSSDILIGIWDTASKTFTDTLSWPSTDPSLKPKAVKVIARRDSSTYGNGPITTFFAGIMGQPTKEVSAKAVANLSGVCIAKPPIPVGISYYRFNNPNYCDTPIRLNPTNDPASCAGWNTYFEGSHSAETLKNR
jgi:Flp pilus assembly protein TadG